MSTLRISVVIPLYNKNNAILHALNSVLAQSILPVEIIIVNDGSTDGSELVVATLKHPLVKLVNQLNQGVSSARNRGIEEAKSEWVAFLDADDVWLPEFLETITILIEKYPDCSMVATSYFLQDSAGNRSGMHLKKILFDGEEGILTNYFQVASNSHPPIHSSAVAIKREALITIGGFPQGVRSGEDLVTWAKLAFLYPVAYSLNPQSVFNLDLAHTYNDIPNRIPQIPDIVGNSLVGLYNQGKPIPGLRQYIGHWHKMRASIYLRLGMRWRSFSEAITSLYYDPANWKVAFYIFMLPLPSGLVNHLFRLSSK